MKKNKQIEDKEERKKGREKKEVHLALFHIIHRTIEINQQHKMFLLYNCVIALFNIKLISFLFLFINI